MLAEILIAYKGTLILVSHDRDFLDQTVTKILAFDGDGKIGEYVGGYSDYMLKKNLIKMPSKNTQPKSQSIGSIQKQSIQEVSERKKTNI